MAVNIYDGYYGELEYGYGTFPNGYTDDLGKYTQQDGQSWDNDISSLYTSEYLAVFTGDDYTGDSYVLAPGFHDVNSLAYYGFNNNISSFYQVYYV